MTVLAISGSPRKGGNSELLIRHAVGPFDNSEATVKIIKLREKEIGPCLARESCTGKNEVCIVEDDMQQVYEDYWDTVTAKHTAGRAPRTAVRRQQDAYLVDAEGCGYCPLR